MPSKSKTKGSSFERELAKHLSDVYGESFTRVVNSGAYVGGKNSFRKNTLSEGQTRSHKGDIVPPDDWKKFNCEAKSYAEFPFHRLLWNVPIPLLEDWIEQTMLTSDDGDVNIIFMKFNRIGRYVVYEQETGFVSDRSITYTDKSGRCWMVTEFESFFKNNTEALKNACKIENP